MLLFYIYLLFFASFVFVFGLFCSMIVGETGHLRAIQVFNRSENKDPAWGRA